jgi:3-hydroxyacyl-CoA dehydrogenase
MQRQQHAVIVGGGIMGADIAAIFAAGETGMKAGRDFYYWPSEKVSVEKARYEAALKRGLAILRGDDESN